MRTYFCHIFDYSIENLLGLNLTIETNAIFGKQNTTPKLLSNQTQLATAYGMGQIKLNFD